MARAEAVLGTMVASTERSLVVIEAKGELAVALRERVDPTLLVIKHAYRSELARVAESCRPWPWMVVSEGSDWPSGLTAVVKKPVLLAWLQGHPSSLPLHAHCFARFADLAAWVDQTLRSEVAGMRLAAGSGVELPGGGHVRSPALQALVSAGSLGFHLPLRSFQGAARTLAAHDLPIRPAMDSTKGRVCLLAARR